MYRTLTTIRRTIAAALTASRALRYRALSGAIAALVDAGRLILVRHLLDRLGADLPDGQQSWTGRHIKKAYRALTGRDPQLVWVQHRTTGRWIHAACYAPNEPALFAGLRSYKATQHLTAADYAEAA